MKPPKFKMTELGTIPEDWGVKRLGEIAETSSGGTPSRTRQDFFQGTVRWFTTTELQDCSLYDSIEHISEEALNNSSAKVFPAGTILMAMYGATIGRLGVLQNQAATNQACCAIFCGKKLLASFAYYYLYHLRPSIIEKGCGAGQPNISQDIVRSLLIALPPLAEQRRIAGALSDVDELISALGKLIEKKRNIKTGTMQQLLTGKRRLPGFGGAKFKQTDLGPIPEDWEVKRLGEIFSMLRNNTYARDALTDDGGKVFNVHYGDILVKYGAKVNFERDEVPCLKAGIKPNKDMLQDGDLIFADTAEDEMVGKAVEVSGLKGRQAVAGLHTVLCRPNADTFALGFLGYFINSAIYHNQLLPLITGTKVSSVSRAGFASTYVCIPPLPEQRAIAAVLSDMDAEIAALETEQAKYARIKSGMMQQLLTGKTRLR